MVIFISFKLRFSHFCRWPILRCLYRVALTGPEDRVWPQSGWSLSEQASFLLPWALFPFCGMVVVIKICMLVQHAFRVFLAIPCQVAIFITPPALFPRASTTFFSFPRVEQIFLHLGLPLCRICLFSIFQGWTNFLHLWLPLRRICLPVLQPEPVELTSWLRGQLTGLFEILIACRKSFVHFTQ